MKRKYGNRAGWKRVVKSSYSQTDLATEPFTGTITLLQIAKVTAPLYVTYGDKRVCIVNDGYSWLHQFPAGQHHVVTTMFDANGTIVQWYIDVCYTHGLGDHNVPWLDDLFLDIVVLPAGDIIEKDADELQEALTNGMIDTSMYQLAKQEAASLLSRIQQGTFPLLALAESHRKLLRSM